MKSLRDTSLAAMLLLVPFSAALVALPAAAQHQTVVAPAAVGSLSLHADAAFAPGSTLRVELNATPGAQWAEVALGASGIRVPLRERHGGHYVGIHVVRQSERIDPTQLMTARLAYGSTTVGRNFTYPSEFQALAATGASDRHDRGRGHGHGRRWDRQAPEISQVTPDAGERVSERRWTRLSARVVDTGSGIDPMSVSLRVNGHEVTDGVRMHEDQVRYRADLAPGRHTAELTVRDHAGNASTRSWSFDVVAGDRYGYYDGRRR